MSGDYWYPVVPSAAGRGRRLSAAGLLIVASALAAVGASAALVLYVSPPEPDGTAVVQIHSGWTWVFFTTDAGTASSGTSQIFIPWLFVIMPLVLGADLEVAIAVERIAMAPMVGAPVTLGAALALVVAVMVARSGSRPLRAGTGLAALAAGLLVGGAASIGLDAAAEVGDARDPGRVWQVVQVGVGTWLVLAAALLALVAVVLVAPLPTVPEEPPRRLLIGIALLPAVAAVAIGGGFGPFVVGRGISAGSPWTVTFTEAGSEHGFDIPLVAPTESPPLLGIALGVGAALALMATLVLVLRTRNPTQLARGRLLGVAASGLVVAVAAYGWLDLAAAMRNAGVLAAAGRDVAAAPGLGAWLVLVAGVMATAVIAVLLVPGPRPLAPAPALPPTPPRIG
jgi:hypothetical protein